MRAKPRFKLEIDSFFVDEYLPGLHRAEGDWYIIQELTACSHVGTHIEAPLHHIRDGKDVADLPFGSLLGEAAVLDFSHKEPEQPIGLQDMLTQETRVLPGDIVLLETGWSKFYSDLETYLRRPYLTLEAAEWLLAQDIRCIGIDASGIENNADIGQPIHKLFLGNGIPIIEDLDNLGALTSNRVFLIALAWKVHGLDASPVRAIAIEPPGDGAL